MIGAIRHSSLSERPLNIGRFFNTEAFCDALISIYKIFNHTTDSVKKYYSGSFTNAVEKSDIMLCDIL